MDDNKEAVQALASELVEAVLTEASRCLTSDCSRVPGGSRAVVEFAAFRILRSRLDAGLSLSDTTTGELERALAVAEDKHPGRWERGDGYDQGDPGSYLSCERGGIVAAGFDEANFPDELAVYLEAVQPQNVRALLAEAKRLRAIEQPPLMQVDMATGNATPVGLRWTTERPKVAGWYCARNHGDDDFECVRVYRHRDGRLAYDGGEFSPDCPLDSFDEWCRIPGPTP